MAGSELRIAGWLASTLLLVACDGGGAVTPTELTLQQRCDDYCARRNADDDCGAMINCAATCSNVLTNAMGCPSELDAFFACSEGADVCAPGGAISCNAENSAIIACGTPDAGP